MLHLFRCGFEVLTRFDGENFKRTKSRTWTDLNTSTAWFWKKRLYPLILTMNIYLLICCLRALSLCSEWLCVSLGTSLIPRCVSLPPLGLICQFAGYKLLLFACSASDGLLNVSLLSVRFNDGLMTYSVCGQKLVCATYTLIYLLMCLQLMSQPQLNHPTDRKLGPHHCCWSCWSCWGCRRGNFYTDKLIVHSEKINWRRMKRRHFIA